MSTAVVFDPWLAEPFSSDAYLDGGLCSLEVTPSPRWGIEHRNVRALHGMVSSLLASAGIAHHERIPRFSLLPGASRLGWSVYLDGRTAVAAAAHSAMPADLFGKLVVARFGAVQRVRAPIVRQRGSITVHVEALTPVVVRRTLRPKDANGELAAGHKYAIHQCPTSDNLHSALTQAFPERLGLKLPWVKELVKVELLARETRAVRVPLLGKYGVVTGWVGSVVLAVNAPALWLLRAAETLGLGGRTAFGFGRVVVREG